MPGLVEKHFLHRGQGGEFGMEADWVRRHLSSRAERVADIGCGIGALFPVIGPSRVVGVDHSDEGLVHTRERFPSTPLVCASADRLPFPDGSIDAVTCQHVIEHLPQCEQACREWHRVLRPGGMLLVLTPSQWFCDPSVYEDETHVRIFQRDDLRSLLAGTGFEVIDLRTIGLPWFRRYHGVRGGWRLRRLVTTGAMWLSTIPLWRWKGQTLCCAARKATQ